MATPAQPVAGDGERATKNWRRALCEAHELPRSRQQPGVQRSHVGMVEHPGKAEAPPGEGSGGRRQRERHSV